MNTDQLSVDQLVHAVTQQQAQIAQLSARLDNSSSVATPAGNEQVLSALHAENQALRTQIVHCSRLLAKPEVFSPTTCVAADAWLKHVQLYVANEVSDQDKINGAWSYLAAEIKPIALRQTFASFDQFCTWFRNMFLVGLEVQSTEAKIALHNLKQHKLESVSTFYFRWKSIADVANLGDATNAFHLSRSLLPDILNYVVCDHNVDTTAPESVLDSVLRAEKAAALLKPHVTTRLTYTAPHKPWHGRQYSGPSSDVTEFDDPMDVNNIQAQTNRKRHRARNNHVTVDAAVCNLCAKPGHFYSDCSQFKLLDQAARSQLGRMFSGANQINDNRRYSASQVIVPLQPDEFFDALETPAAIDRVQPNDAALDANDETFWDALEPNLDEVDKFVDASDWSDAASEADSDGDIDICTFDESELAEHVRCRLIDAQDAHSIVLDGQLRPATHEQAPAPWKFPVKLLIDSGATHNFWITSLRVPMHSHWSHCEPPCQ
jgi:hypothetical protein